MATALQAPVSAPYIPRRRVQHYVRSPLRASTIASSLQDTASSSSTKSDFNYVTIAIAALQDETGLSFEADNPSIPPLVTQMNEYILGQVGPVSRFQIERKMRHFIRCKMLCGKEVEDEESEAECKTEQNAKETPVGRRRRNKSASYKPKDCPVSTGFVDREECIDESFFEGGIDDDFLTLHEGER